MKKILFLVFLFLLMTACPMDIADTIYIENKSDYQIYYCLSKEYPDTMLPVSCKGFPFSLYLVKSHEVDMLNSLAKWKKIFTDYFPKDTLIIFFFDADTIKRYDWDIIRKENKIIEWRIYSKQYLQSNGWRIVYP